MRTVNLFTYGRLKRGGENHKHLSDEIEEGFAQFRGATWVEGFQLYILQDLPVAIPGDGTIHGELYVIPRSLLLAEIDSVEGFPHTFDRKQIEIEGNTYWIYYQSSIPPGAKKIDDGLWQPQK